MKNRRKKITTEALVDYFEGRLDSQAALAMEQALAAEPDSQTILDWLRRYAPLLGEAAATSEFQPSPAAVASVRQLFRDRQRELRPVSLPTLVARLVFDSRRALAPTGARGDQHSNFQVVYSTDAHDVDLWQEKLSDGNWYLIGQILPKDGGDAITPHRGVLTTAEAAPLLTEMREGEFFISMAHEGRYDLRLELADSQIVMNDVLVGARVE